MESRRAFLKKASLLAGASALTTTVPAAIQRALAISAQPGSTYLDAEHVVFLMQENRSFDHCYGTLKGVRGFNDPRAIQLANGLPVWMQSNKKGETFAPFRLDIKNTKSTWMGSLPHGWDDMLWARHEGKMDTWLEAKKAGNKAYQHMPLTMGYYDRQDIPFYYALADAFTVCDQHFCSSLTGTSANRSYFWSGTIREEAHNPDATAHVNNSQINYKNIGWKTFPERLQEAGIDWKVYQNELSIPVGFEGEEEDWLANFTDNNLEFSKQYHVRFHPAHRTFMQKALADLQKQLDATDLEESERAAIQKKVIVLQQDLETFSEANFEQLSAQEKEIHRRAFITNTADPDYHSLTSIQVDGKAVNVPKGDIFHQFRKDVQDGSLPMVSWLVAPCNFSDHPGAPWYGAWYISEALDILTKNPEVWKKTIFILTYDENDGYFDHIPPYVPPRSNHSEDGATTGIDTREEFVNDKDAIGLGFRVPLVIASPWSKGGYVNSEVFDHTSSLQFLEHFIEKKTGKKIKEDNISAWRRIVCGNLTSVFRQADIHPVDHRLTLDRNKYVERIFAAKEKALPGNFARITTDALAQHKANRDWQSLLPKQEPGTRPSCAIPYNLAVNAFLQKDQQTIRFNFICQTDFPKTKNVGAPFQLYAVQFNNTQSNAHGIWNFTVKENTPLSYHVPFSGFQENKYHFRVYGPNGFYREFQGGADDPELMIAVTPDSSKKQLLFQIKNLTTKTQTIKLVDNAYHHPNQVMAVKTGDHEVALSLTDSFGWYDYSLFVEGFSAYEQRFAGHIENGEESSSDPLMGQAIQIS